MKNMRRRRNIATEKMEAFLAALRANPGAAEKLNGGEKAKTEEEKTGAITELAREMGYELTKDDLAALHGGDGAGSERKNGRAHPGDRDAG